MCAARSYNLAFDNIYNQKIADVLKKYDMNRDTNGEPDLMMYANSRMVGGGHPHMVHMGVQEDLPYTPLPRPNRPGLARRRYMGEMTGAGRPPGGVSPYVEPLAPNDLIDPGTMAAYPIYNALEMKSIGGACCRPCMMDMKPNVVVVEKKVGGKRKSYGKKVLGDVGKIGKEVGTTVLKDLAKEAIKSAFKPGAKPTGGKRGRKKRETEMKPEPDPEQMFTEIQQGGMFMGMNDKRDDEEKKDDAKKAQKTVKKTVKKVFGGKASASRAKRAEIVKKIMKEKGMKMTDASRFVKENNLY
jgi:hypothetical protein